MTTLRPVVFWLWVTAVWLLIMFAIYRWGHSGSVTPNPLLSSD